MLRDDLLVLLSVLSAAGILGAQRTWIVDRQNRAGADFTDLQPAVDAAAPGDVLEVRYVDWATTGLWYEAPTIHGKGIVIRGDPVLRAPVMGEFRITLLPADQRVLLGNLANGDQHYDNRARTLPYRGVVGSDCAGTIQLDNMRIGAPPNTSASRHGYGPLSVDRCSLVTVSNSELWQCASNFGVTVSDGRLVITNSRIGGGPQGQFMQWLGTLWTQTGSETWIVDSIVTGSDGWYYAPLSLFTRATPAIRMCGGTVHVSAGCQILGGWDVIGSHFGVYGDFSWMCPLSQPQGTAEIDPRSPTLAYGASLNISFPYVPGLTWFLQRTGQTVALRQYSAPNSPVAYAASPLQPGGVQLPFGPLFLDPTAMHVLAVLPGNPTGQHDLSLPLVPLPAIGTTLAVQGISLLPTGELRLSNVTTPGVY